MVRIGGAAEPKISGLNEFLLCCVKKESERFLQHRGSAKRRDENGLFRFGGEVEGRLWAMEKGGGRNSHGIGQAKN